MNIYLISDTHFNHNKMVEYCNRPENHTELIKKNLFVFNSTIRKDDVFIHLGDVCIGKDEEIHNEVIVPLACKKWLVKGNHDRKSDSWYMNHGWDFVADSFKGKYFGKEILFSHCPMKDDGKFDVNVFGHFHNNLSRLLEGRYVVEGEEERNKEDLAVLTGKHRLFVLEDRDYKPVKLSEFLIRN